MKPLFEKYQKHFEVFYWVISGFITAVINGYSVVADNERRQLSFETWEPFVWEFSSQIAILVLVPLVLLLDKKRPLQINTLKLNLALHLVYSVLFSLLHVLLMVALRKFFYSFSQSSYDFGDWQAELIYEYRKDLLTYISIITTFYVYRFIVSRLRSEAKEINMGEDKLQSTFVERLIVKKIGREFILKVSDIEWVEADGNYMNLHINQRCYPLRSTMSGLIERLDPHHFARIHRSCIVNLDAISEITPLDSGDFEVLLNHGKKLKLSRRYRENVKVLLAG